MTQGYVFLGVDDANSDVNIACAAALSLSLRVADPWHETCVVVNKFSDVPKRYEKMFDYIVELPFGRTDSNHHNTYIDFWQSYYCTPFDENIFMDTNSIAVDNAASLWNVSGVADLMFGTALDFRGVATRNSERFVVQDRNSIPAFDAGMLYFTKDRESSEFFKLADPVFKNWRDIYRDRLSEFKATDFDFTLMVNITAQLTGNQYQFPRYFDYTDLELNFTWDPDVEDETNWTESLNLWITDDMTVKVNNHRQTGIVRYGNADYMTDEMIQKLNDNYRKSKAKMQA
jgi:hypothetical protein